MKDYLRELDNPLERITEEGFLKLDDGTVIKPAKKEDAARLTGIIDILAKKDGDLYCTELRLSDILYKLLVCTKS